MEPVVFRSASLMVERGMSEAPRASRCRLETWVAEQLRVQEASEITGKRARTAAEFAREVEKQAAYTLLNRLVLLRLLEAPGPGGHPLRAPAVVTGGWESRAYQDFRQI